MNQSTTVLPSTASVSISRQWLRLVLPVLFLVLLVFFAVNAPGFLSVGNLSSVLLNNFALLAIVAIGMTLAISAGGIDLSVSVALDLAALTFVVSLNAGFGLFPAIVSAILVGGLTGMFNAVLISGLRISPFLATLGTLFIGTSVQQLLSDGGQPIYLAAQARPALASIVVLGIPLPLLIVAVLAAGYGVALAKGRFGRQVLAIGEQPEVARYSGVPVQRITARVFIACALACSVAGILLSSTVNAYVPMSGNAFLINAIGAVFIGTTLNRHGRANVPGTLLGVLFLNITANGLLLIGWNFYWQQVATGALILLVLSFSYLGRRVFKDPS